MFNQELVTLYNHLVSRQTDQQRFATGGTADLLLLTPGLVAKSDKTGYQFVEREYRFMRELWESGFRDMPKPQEDWGLGFTPEATLVMEEILHSVQLEEVAQAYLEGIVPKFMMKHILDLKEEVFAKFWSTGAVHADPHLKNILVNLDQQQNWRVWLIDFGLSFWEGNDDRAMPSTVGSMAKDREKHSFYLSQFGIDQL
ncbi:MAG: lipopolysaccharide kinase InaA family protein [Halothece sp.]